MRLSPSQLRAAERHLGAGLTLHAIAETLDVPFEAVVIGLFGGNGPWFGEEQDTTSHEPQPTKAAVQAGGGFPRAASDTAPVESAAAAISTPMQPETANDIHERASINDEASPEAGPQAEASPAGTGTGTPADREARHEGQGASATLPSSLPAEPRFRLANELGQYLRKSGKGLTGDVDQAWLGTQEQLDEIRRRVPALRDLDVVAWHV